MRPWTLTLGCGIWALLGPAASAQAQHFSLELGAGVLGTERPQELEGPAMQFSASAAHAWNDAWTTRLGGGYERTLHAPAPHVPWLLAETQYALDILRVEPLLGGGLTARLPLGARTTEPVWGGHLLLGVRTRLSGPWHGSLLMRMGTTFEGGFGTLSGVLQIGYLLWDGRPKAQVRQ